MAEKMSQNRTVTPSDAKKALRKCVSIKRPVFLWGAPGIGKSDIVAQIGQEQGREVIDVRLNLWEPTDIKGIPYFNSTMGTMTWAPPAELPTDPASTAILFLDELSSAAPATQAAAYQLILNRRVGTYKLPEGVSIIAAGNREADKGVTYRMPSPLANRFLHLELRTDYDDWMSWATLAGVHEQVVGYVSFAKQDLYDFDPKNSSRAFATPRSWSFVSDLLHDDDLPDNVLTDLIAGAIGEGLAVKFMAHRLVAKQMPKPADILSGKVEKCEIKEISAMFSLATAMCYELRDEYSKQNRNYYTLADNFFKFMMANFPTEIIVMGVAVAIKNFNIKFDGSRMSSFEEFSKRFRKYIIAAYEK